MTSQNCRARGRHDTERTQRTNMLRLARARSPSALRRGAPRHAVAPAQSRAAWRRRARAWRGRGRRRRRRQTASCPPARSCAALSWWPSRTRSPARGWARRRRRRRRRATASSARPQAGNTGPARQVTHDARRAGVTRQSGVGAAARAAAQRRDARARRCAAHARRRDEAAQACDAGQRRTIAGCDQRVARRSARARRRLRRHLAQRPRERRPARAL